MGWEPCVGDRGRSLAQRLGGKPKAGNPRTGRIRQAHRMRDSPELRMDRCNSSATAATLSSIILFMGSAVVCILLRRHDKGNDNSDSLFFPRNFSWGGRPAPESDEACKAWLLSARRVDKFSSSVLNYVPAQFSFAKEQQQLDDDGLDETT